MRLLIRKDYIKYSLVIDCFFALLGEEPKKDSNQLFELMNYYGHNGFFDRLKLIDVKDFEYKIKYKLTFRKGLRINISGVRVKASTETIKKYKNMLSKDFDFNDPNLVNKKDKIKTDKNGNNLYSVAYYDRTIKKYKDKEKAIFYYVLSKKKYDFTYSEILSDKAFFLAKGYDSKTFGEDIKDVLNLYLKNKMITKINGTYMCCFRFERSSFENER